MLLLKKDIFVEADEAAAVAHLRLLCMGNDLPPKLPLPHPATTDLKMLKKDNFVEADQTAAVAHLRLLCVGNDLPPPPPFP